MATKVKKAQHKQHGAAMSDAVNSYIKNEMERLRYDIQESTRLITMDVVTIALGRMGFRASKFKQFKEELDKAWVDYGEAVHESRKDDAEMWEAKARIDREIGYYVGKELFVPYDDRHHLRKNH